MIANDFQSSEIGVPLGHAFLETQQRIGRRDYAAATDLAYACHNLPSFQNGCDHFDWDFFREQFARFHQWHGMALFNFLAMLKASEEGGDVREVAFNPFEVNASKNMRR